MEGIWISGPVAVALVACSGPNAGGVGAFEADEAGSAASYGTDASEPEASPSEDAQLALQIPDSAGSPTCTAGHYAGTYTGTNDSSKVGGPTGFPIAGPMALDLVATSMNGESFLALNQGNFDLAWGTTGADASSGLIVVSAKLSGNLNCTNGDFAASDPSAPWTTLGLPTGTATVSFTGTYSASTATISGPFNVTDSLSTSTGTWTVTLAP
jgi:hypothetical protein